MYAILVQIVVYLLTTDRTASKSARLRFRNSEEDQNCPGIAFGNRKRVI